MKVFPSILLVQNQSIQLSVNVNNGGRIDYLFHRLTGKQWLWHPGKMTIPESLPIGASYDDNWAGGWDELFPNDAECDFAGRHLPDHGELWSQPWEVISHARSDQVHLHRSCVTVPVTVEKTIRVGPEAPEFSIRYRIINHGSEALPFLLKLHPAMAIQPGDTLLLPGGTVTPVDLSFSQIVCDPGPFQWPFVKARDGRMLDLSQVPPPENRLQEFVYVTGLPQGWCGLRDGKTGAEVHIEFPLDVLSYCWLFMTCGGWRDHYTAVLEPCTNVPKDLHEAYRRGTCAALPAGARLDFSVRVQLRHPHV